MVLASGCAGVVVLGASAALIAPAGVSCRRRTTSQLGERVTEGTTVQDAVVSIVRSTVEYPTLTECAEFLQGFVSSLTKPSAVAQIQSCVSQLQQGLTGTLVLDFKPKLKLNEHDLEACWLGTIPMGVLRRVLALGREDSQK